MDCRTDQQLLQAYAGEGSEAAFSEIVRRHIDLVYSAAFRLLNNAYLAEDVSQKVFLALAHNARQLTDRAVLAGWLHTTARNVAAKCHPLRGAPPHLGKGSCRHEGTARH